MVNKIEKNIRTELFSILDVVRGAAEIEVLTKYSMGVILLLLEKDSKEQMTVLVSQNTIDLNNSLLKLSYHLEATNEKYRNVFSDYCFYAIDKIPVRIAQLLVDHLMFTIKKYENNDTFTTTIFKTLLPKEYKKRHGSYGYDEPDWFLELVCRLADIEDGQAIFDPFANDAQVFSTINLVYKNPSVSYYGCEVNIDSYYRARINMILQKKDNARINNCDALVSLENPVLEFDRVITLPPLSVRHQLYDEIIKVNYRQFKYGIPSRSQNDWLYIQSAIAATKEDGKTVIVTSKGPLFRSNEGKIRKEVLKDDILEAIIEFPSHTMANTSIPIIVLIFNKQKPDALKNKILFIDASDLKEKVQAPSKYAVMSISTIDRIIDIYTNARVVDKISYIIDRSEIETDNYSLDLGEYFRNIVIKEKLKGYVRLKEKIIEITRGVQVAPKLLEEVSTKENRTHYFINLSNLNDGEIKFDETNLIAPQIKWMKNYQILPGDLLIAARGSFKCAVAKENIPPLIASANIIIVRLGNDYDPHVLKYYFESEIGKRLVEQMQSGVTASNINPSKFEDILIPNISYEKQIKTAKMIIETDEMYRKMLEEARNLLAESKKKINKTMNLEPWEV